MMYLVAVKILGDSVKLHYKCIDNVINMSFIFDNIKVTSF